MQGTHLRKYGVQTTIDFTLFEVDGVDFRIDAVHASGDTKIMKDEGVEANTTNGFTDEGQGYSIVLDATEMQAARIVGYIVDSTTKVWLDTSFVIETYGNASAMHAFDFDLAEQTVALSAQGKLDVNAEADTALTDYDAVIPADLNDPTAAVIADAVWNEDATTHQTTGTFGQAIGDPVANTKTLYAALVTDAAGASVTADVATVNTDLSNATDGLGAIKTSVDAIPTTAMRGTDGANTTTPSTVGAIADQVWDEVQADHVTAGSFGVIASEIASIPTTAMRGTDNAATATNLATVDTVVDGIQTDLSNATDGLGAIKAETALIVADTNELQVDDVPTLIAAVQSDTDDIQTRLPAALSSGNMKVDVLAISTSTDAADKLEASAEVLITGLAETGTLSTTVMTSNLGESTDDHFIGRTIIWTSGVLLGQASDITDYAGVNGTVTYTAVTEAPSNGDSFVIV